MFESQRIEELAFQVKKKKEKKRSSKCFGTEKLISLPASIHIYHICYFKRKVGRFLINCDCHTLYHTHFLQRLVKEFFVNFTFLEWNIYVKLCELSPCTNVNLPYLPPTQCNFLVCFEYTEP